MKNQLIKTVTIAALLIPQLSWAKLPNNQDITKLSKTDIPAEVLAMSYGDCVKFFMSFNTRLSSVQFVCKQLAAENKTQAKSNDYAEVLELESEETEVAF